MFIVLNYYLRKASCNCGRNGPCPCPKKVLKQVHANIKMVYNYRPKNARKNVIITETCLYLNTLKNVSCVFSQKCASNRFDSPDGPLHYQITSNYYYQPEKCCFCFGSVNVLECSLNCIERLLRHQ